MRHLLADIRYGWRRLWAAPAVTAITVGTIAIAIGSTTAVYSLLYVMVFRPSNVKDSQQLVNLYHSSRMTGPAMSFAWPDYQDIKANQDTFEELVAWSRLRAPLTEGSHSEMVMGEAVEGNYFSTLGVAALHGRPVDLSDDHPSASPVLVLSERLWRNRFGGDEAIVGRSVKLQGKAFTVIGVMPASFRGVDMPNLLPTAVWIPISQSNAIQVGSVPTASLSDRSYRWVRIKARLKPTASISDANTQLQAIGRGLDKVLPVIDPSAARSDWQVRPASSVHMLESMDRLGLPISYGVAASLLLVLVVASVNVANLLLAQASSRTNELATRIAVGASRGRLLRQLLTENAVMCAAGAVLGLLLAFILTKLLAFEFALGRTFDVVFEPRLELPVLAATVLGFVVVVAIAGVVPARRYLTVDVRAGMAGNGKRWVTGERLLAAFQLGISIALLAVGGMFLRGFTHVVNHETGFDLSKTALINFELDYRWPAEPETARRFLQTLQEESRALAGIDAAAIASSAPIGGYGGHALVTDEEVTSARRNARGSRAAVISVGPGALEIFGVPLLYGRFVDETDTVATRPVAVISETLAQTIFGIPNPVGRQASLLLQQGRTGRTLTIVGVARDTDVGSLGQREIGVAYLPFAQYYQSEVSLVVRASGDPESVTGALSALVRELDSEVVGTATTGRRLLANEAIPTRVGAAIAGGLGSLAFALSLVGLYGVMSQLVSKRTHEIGIRMAFGAQPRSVVAQVLKEGAVIVAIGTIVGFVTAYWLGALLRHLIFGLEHGGTYGLVATTGCLSGAAMLACWVPARRAARVEPVIALRHSR